VPTLFTMGVSNPLQKQLEEQRFLNGLSYVRQAAGGLKKLNSSELAHLNKLLTEQKQDPSKEPWRFQATTVQIPGGAIEMQVHSNPINQAREITGNALLMAGNLKLKEAACYLYSELVLEHLFEDGNRRTAVLATVWLLGNSGVEVDGQKLLKIPIGNLRDPLQLEQFHLKISQLI
jgi:hypothetical protein